MSAPNPYLQPESELPADDPSVLQILMSEHASLSTARSLAYNEAFTRGDMFMGFVSMSLVALALIAQALPFYPDVLIVAALVLTFDLIVGLTTFGRILAASYEDYRAVHGMARIRHGYQQLAPAVRPYITSSSHDDLAGVMVSYGTPPTRGASAVLYGLTTSAGMLTLILSMIGAVLAAIGAILAGGSAVVAVGAGAVAFLGLFTGLGAATLRYYTRKQAVIPVLFPTPPDQTDS